MKIAFLFVYLSLFLIDGAAYANSCQSEAENRVLEVGVLSREGENLSHLLEFGEGKFAFLADLAIKKPEEFKKYLGKKRQKFYLGVMGKEVDRWGRYPAILMDHEYMDLSEELLNKGIAIVQPYLRSFNCLKYLLKYEQQTRFEKRGIWKDKNVISDHGSIPYADWGSYWIVEGTLLSVGRTRTRLYLNFGERWTEDLTGIIEREQLEEFERFGHDLQSLKGKRVRLRGVMQLNNGPEFMLSHPAQLELLD